MTKITFLVDYGDDKLGISIKENKKQMAEIRHFPQGGFQATWENVARKVAPAGQPAPTVEKYCVYNQSRGRFVATSVEAVDATSGGAEARLRNLEPGAGGGLWLLPCPEISPTSIRFLVDLVYLNREGAVLAAVESFPLVKAAVSSTMAGSVLVLAEGTVAAGEIHIGDRLIVASPDEMKRHLQMLKEAKAAAQEAASSSREQHQLSSPEGKAASVAENPESAHPRVDPISTHASPQAPAAPVASSPASAPAAPIEAGPAPIPLLSTWLNAAEPANADLARTASGATAIPSAPGPASQDANERAQPFVEPSYFGAAKTPRSAFEPLPTAVQQGAPTYQYEPPSAYEPRSALFEPRSAAPAPSHSASPQIPEGKPPAQQQPAPALNAGDEVWKKRKPAKGWFAKLLNSEPEDPRIASRESLPGLIAYYFTGGTPQPYAVRDISPTGMYILTEERWYPGTVVRATLTDRSNPSAERSITVNAKAVRAGSDGVGFEFVLEERDQGRVREAERMERANGMYFDEVQEFLRIYKSK